MPQAGVCTSNGRPYISFGAPDDDQMSIMASERGSPAEAEDSKERRPSAGATLSEADAEVAALLLRVARNIGLEVPKAPLPEHSRLDDWYFTWDSAAKKISGQ
ncbi:hypothetical protein Q8A67_018756 [Cirrhinus molitorella]|uniref:Uncharacterized protein n=1 Tax=Cirrhinus molitorella TaxID=172907 RepID=A0AA88THQ3_9TELE|nr:hypothetical protein Q8A67_018756 [Cirrhinus molitorella]